MSGKGRLNILCFAEYWDDMWRRRQQIAWRLAQSELVKHVVYIERPLPVTSFIKFLFRRADHDGMERWRRVLRNRSWVMPVGKKLSVLTTFAPLPPIGVAELFWASEWARDRWLYFRMSQLKKQIDLNCPLVWVSHPQLSINVIRTMEPGLLWYDCTEDFAAWPGIPTCVRAQIETTDRWLTGRADVITAVSRTLYEEKRQINPNTYWLPNAVDTDLFLQHPENVSVPPELLGVKRPVLAFVGGLNDWAHDWELLERVATLRPQWTFLLIGSLSVSSKTQKMLSGHSNIICVGQKPYQELPAYLGHSDVCFLFYRRIRKNNTGNSQKLFLYFAVGKPVVSTPSADIGVYDDFVEIVKTAGDFVAGVERVMAHDSSEGVMVRREFARENSWSSRVDQVFKIFEECGLK